jgi:predicted MFS family arabinose efflux permease
LAAFLGWHGYFFVLGVLGVLACAIIVVSLKALSVQIAARNTRETGEEAAPAASPS